MAVYHIGLLNRSSVMDNANVGSSPISVTKKIDMEFINLLRPKNTFSEKVRIGPNQDGGYVLTKGIIDNSKCVFTYGYGGDSNFEEDLYGRYNIPSYIYDHTNNCIPEYFERDGLKFFPEGLGFKDNCGDFLEHYKQNNINDYVLLKIDIEWDEYPYLTNINLKELSSKVSGIIIEIHNLNYDDNRNNFIKIFTELEDDFTLCHSHVNNTAQFPYKDVLVPCYFELTLINKKFVEREEYETDFLSFPIEGLDYQNDFAQPDINMGFLHQFPKN